MAFRVRKWPVQPDPRPSLFTFKGWNWGEVPSWRWEMSAVGAEGIYAFLNDGIILNQGGFTDDVALWQGATQPTVPTVCTLAKEGFEMPVGGSPHTIELRVNIAPPAPTEPSTAGLDLLFPDAIQEFIFGTLLIDGVPNEEIPGGVTLTPVIWAFEP